MKTADPVATMVESERIIRAWNPDQVTSQKKADLRLALAIFSGLVIEDLNVTAEILKIDREWLEQSVVVQHWLRQGREQGLEQGLQQGIEKGIEQGLIRARREDLLSVLKSRFGTVEPSVEAIILRIEDSVRLQALLARAAIAASVEEFSRELRS